MKYLKEVCDECGFVKERELKINKTIYPTMKGFKISMKSLHSEHVIRDQLGETKEFLCSRCYGKAKEEIEEMISKSKYLEYSDIDIF